MSTEKLCPHCGIPITYSKQHYDDGDFDWIPECKECGAEWG